MSRKKRSLYIQFSQSRYEVRVNNLISSIVPGKDTKSPTYANPKTSKLFAKTPSLAIHHQSFFHNSAQSVVTSKSHPRDMVHGRNTLPIQLTLSAHASSPSRRGVDSSTLSTSLAAVSSLRACIGEPGTEWKDCSDDAELCELCELPGRLLAALPGRESAAPPAGTLPISGSCSGAAFPVILALAALHAAERASFAQAPIVLM